MASVSHPMGFSPRMKNGYADHSEEDCWLYQDSQAEGLEPKLLPAMSVRA